MYVISHDDCLFFYFYDSIRGLIGPFASLLDFIILLFRYLAFGRIRRDQPRVTRHAVVDFI